MQENSYNPNPNPNAWVRFHDYEYALILGLIIGVFLIPTEKHLGLGHVTSLFYLFSICGFPLFSLLGLVIARFLFSKVRVLWQFVKFGLIGVSNTAINFGVLNILALLTGIDKGPATGVFEAVAFLFALTNSYFWNSHWSFENKNPRTTAEFLKFTTVTVVGLFLSSGIITVVTGFHHPGISDSRWLNISNLIATLIVAFWNFSGFKFIVFKE